MLGAIVVRIIGMGMVTEHLAARSIKKAEHPSGGSAISCACGLNVASTATCVAGSRGFEPPVSALTGPHVRPLHHEPIRLAAQRRGF